MTSQAARKIKISPEVLIQEVEGEAVLLDLRSERYYGLDEVGTRIWQLLVEHRELEPVCATLLEEYEVEEAQLRADLAALLERLEAAGIVTIEDEDAQDRDAP